jgi:hypothetical protein
MASFEELEAYNANRVFDWPFGLTERLLLYLSKNPGASRSSIINFLSHHFNERQDSIASTLYVLTMRQRIVESVSYRMPCGARLDVGPTRYWPTST